LRSSRLSLSSNPVLPGCRAPLGYIVPADPSLRKCDPYQEKVALTQGSGRLTGIVTGDAGRPVKYLWITVNSAGDGLHHYSSVVDSSSADGSISLEHMIPGEDSISKRPGFEAQREVPDSADLDLLVQEGPTTWVRSVPGECVPAGRFPPRGVTYSRPPCETTDSADRPHMRGVAFAISASVHVARGQTGRFPTALASQRRMH
jgi:hypothetical protein